jgi:hypothetical protein
VGSCFEEFIARNTMVQSDLNYDTWFRIYDLFTSKSMEYVLMSVISALLAWCYLVGYGMREKRPKDSWIWPIFCSSRYMNYFRVGWLAGFRKHPWSAGRAPRVWPPGLPSLHPWWPGHDRPLWGRRGTAVGYLKKRYRSGPISLCPCDGKPTCLVPRRRRASAYLTLGDFSFSWVVMPSTFCPSG